MKTEAPEVSNSVQSSPATQCSATRLEYYVAGYMVLFTRLTAFILLLDFDWRIAAAWVLSLLGTNAYKRLEALSPKRPKLSDPAHEDAGLQ